MLDSLNDYGDSLLATSPMLAAALANAYMMGGAKANQYSATDDSLEMMVDAADQIARDAGREPVGYAFDPVQDPNRMDAFQRPAAYGSNTRADNANVYKINYNPSAHHAYVAHEMGHGQAQQEPVGKAIHDLKHGQIGNDKIRQVLAIGKRMSPAVSGSIATLTQGDDDLAASIAAEYAMASPEIADEILASMRAEDIIRASNDGKMTPGSRGRLLGALATYLTMPAAKGAAANYVGNLADDYIVGPPSNPANVG